MRIGMIGLGRMGAGMTERLRRDGHEVVGYDRDPDKRDVASIDELVESLESPRVVWVMVPAGEPTQLVVDELVHLLDHGDIIVEGGNSNVHDTMRRAAHADQAGIGFVDAGVSGGVWGLQEGFCLMVGGDPRHYQHIEPVLRSLAPPDGLAHVGPSGAGHFTKMVHNAIEYGMMQAFAEGYELLGASELDIDIKAATSAWRNGSVIRSWLLDLLVNALDEDPGLRSIRGYADDSGEGRWAVEEAVRLAVPAPVTSAALFARFGSRQDDSPAMKVIAALRNQFGGHAVKSAEG